MTTDFKYAQATEALKEFARLVKLALEHYERGDQDLARELRRVAAMKDEEAKRLLKESSATQ